MDEKLYTKALRYLSRRPRSEKEVRDYVKKILHRHSGKRVNERIQNFSGVKRSWTSQDDEVEKIESIIKLLTAQKFLNDQEFTSWWIDQRTRIRPKGWRVIEMELEQKGISREIIKIQDLRFKIQEGETGRDEKKLALELVEKRIKKYQAMSKDELYRKLGGFLTRRGFDRDIIRSCVDAVLKKSV